MIDNLLERITVTRDSSPSEVDFAANTIIARYNRLSEESFYPRVEMEITSYPEGLKGMNIIKSTGRYNVIGTSPDQDSSRYVFSRIDEDSPWMLGTYTGRVSFLYHPELDAPTVWSGAELLEKENHYLYRYFIGDCTIEELTEKLKPSTGNMGTIVPSRIKYGRE